MKILSPCPLLATAALSLASCLQLPPMSSDTCHREDCTEHGAQPVPREPDPWARSSSEPTVLYARDGKPVQADESVASAPVEPEAPNARDVEREDGRLYLLELYQMAVDERDDLMSEVSRQESVILDLRSMQATLETQFAEMQMRMQQLELDKHRAEEQGYELANRLTTAQIGRLQAELKQLQTQALEVGIPVKAAGDPVPSGESMQAAPGAQPDGGSN